MQPRAGMITEAEAAQRAEQAVAAVRAEMAMAVAAARTEAVVAAAAADNQGQSVHGAAGGVSEEEVARRVEDAVSRAKAEADQDADEQLTDLLVCLGQEEQKVALLSEKLSGYGVDVDALLATIKPDEDEEDVC